MGKSKSSTPSGESIVKVTKLTEDDDIEGYLTTFERQMTAYEINKKRWVYLLAPKLAGKAQQAYMALDDKDAGDYDAIKRAILKRYGVNEESYRRKFRKRVRKAEESYTNLATDIMDLGKRWLAECKTMQEVLEKIAIGYITLLSFVSLSVLCLVSMCLCSVGRGPLCFFVSL